jgi:acyl-coenzyme A synthetase/AMP-(fatty) acid ligase
MNCSDMFLNCGLYGDNDPLLLDLSKSNSLADIVTYGDFQNLIIRAQKNYQNLGVKTGDKVLVFALPSVELYAIIIASITLGVEVIFMEPWLKIEYINEFIEKISPKVMITGLLGKLISFKMKSVKNIPIKFNPKNLSSVYVSPTDKLIVENLDSNHIASMAFTSGTTSAPKAVPRSHGYLIEQIRVLRDHAFMNQENRVDLTAFPNLILSNMAMGSMSLLVSKWNKKTLKRIDHLPQSLSPTSLVGGPAFIKDVLDVSDYDGYKNVYVGGALTDRWIFEKAIKRWGAADLRHIYGSSEAEPVNIVDAAESVRESKKRDFFQCLHLGKPNNPHIELKFTEESLWVTGKHVCTHYLYNDEENKKNKENDGDKIWHRMGDRITQTDAGLWYTGRSKQTEKDFLLEQGIYTHMQSSKSFIHVENDKRYLCGEGVSARSGELKSEFPEIDEFRETKIIRDRRHKARIDRKRSLTKVKL